MAEETRGARIGRRVRALREEGLYTRSELGERAGLSEQAIAHLEAGLVARPRRTTIEKLAWALGVPVAALLEDSPKAPLSARAVPSKFDTAGNERGTVRITGAHLWAAAEEHAKLEALFDAGRINHDVYTERLNALYLRVAAEVAQAVQGKAG